MPTGKNCVVCGGGGFIGSHLAKKLKENGNHVRVVDWKRNEYFQESEYCDEFILGDLREKSVAAAATKGMDIVYNLAADMGGMGFIQSNHSLILYNNTMISVNVLEAAREAKAKTVFYASSACIYPEHIQDCVDNPGLKEVDAWPAAPQDAYGLEKLMSEELHKHYAKDFGMNTRIARFHNIYGPQGTWKGGREKAPAAFCRKVIAADTEMEMWGDGLQTRSFLFIDDCVAGIIRLTDSDYGEPMNIGSEEMVAMNDFAKMAMSFENKKLRIKHIPGPEGVRGRNSNNDLVRKVLNWDYTTSLEEGLRKTYYWIKDQVDGP
ncbi:GDP-mannose 3,5-epimerase [Sphaeroforma arctica JP610]|uniref:GDP-mannose 3,5-epimerase n=1 Tax=Sphaeroforma arctica JP610 TaxID=667725 RepID=A0A0L0FRV2_9EUKA|nr:GDP-mannose 3,5-epimerase [Sphaeroforma arctica JP610]KNC78693.1 GDP-mannose 3,5-epimerase [Sphaeroforma arctica JP610]|eukprot:XP_014152595.1 GDP-mannose 3,5-epimerase [Sphaeroforma arctica JP610]